MINEIVNDGKGTQPKLKRNQDIVADYQAKMSIPEMVAKYKVSPTVIYNVLARYDITKNRKAVKAKIRKLKVK